MRTTLNIDDDVLDLLREYAQARSLAAGKAASELMRRGLEAPVHTRLVHGFHTVVLPGKPGRPKVSSEHVKRLLEDEV